MADKLPLALQNANRQSKSTNNKIQSLFWSSFCSRLLLTPYKTSAQTVQTLQFAQWSRNFFSVNKQRIREPGDNSHFLRCHQPVSPPTHQAKLSWHLLSPLRVAAEIVPVAIANFNCKLQRLAGQTLRCRGYFSKKLPSLRFPAQ